MKISDIMKDDGLFGILSEDDDAEEGKKKHKKSKDKGKKKSKDRSVEYETANARLKEMSKGELRLRCQEYGVKGSEADFNSKKSMRHAILRAMGLKKSGPVMPLTIHDQISTPAQGPVGLNPDATLEELVKERPPRLRLRPGQNSVGHDLLGWVHGHGPHSEASGSGGRIR